MKSTGLTLLYGLLKLTTMIQFDISCSQDQYLDEGLDWEEVGVESNSDLLQAFQEVCNVYICMMFSFIFYLTSSSPRTCTKSIWIWNPDCLKL